MCLDNHFIADCFLPNHSTSSALLSSTHFIASALDNQFSVCGIFLDHKKAFDSVRTQKPLIDPLSSYNLPPILITWIHSFLSSRSQSVSVNDSSSSASHVVSGVPQGSVLFCSFSMSTKSVFLRIPSQFLQLHSFISYTAGEAACEADKAACEADEAACEVDEAAREADEAACEADQAACKADQADSES